jgi:simple sugar transport system substrate-binding protein
MRKVAPDAQLVAVTHHWGEYYKQRVQAVLDGSWKSGNVWGGVKQGMIRVGDFGSKVPTSVQDEVLARQKQIASGKLLPFAGPISDNTGKPVVAKGKALADPQILAMDVLVEGVQGKLPRP